MLSTELPALNSRRRLRLIALILFELLITYFVFFILFSDVFRGRDFSFIRFQDTEFETLGSYLAVDALRFKELPLWNWWDNSNFGFAYLSGAFNYPSIFTGILFWSLDFLLPASTDSYTFYDLHKFSYIFLPMLIRSYGLLKLAELLNISRVIAVFAGVWVSVSIGYTSVLGLTISTIYSFIPLMLYYLLKLKRSRRFVYLGRLALCLTFIALGYPLVFFGYFFQFIHLSFCSIIIWLTLSGGVKSKLKSFLYDLFNNLIVAKLFTLSLLSAVFAFLAYLYMQEFSKLEFGVSSRLEKNTPLSYFSSAHMGSNLEYFPGIMLNPTKAMWATEFQFIGIVFILFTIIGFVKTRSPIRWLAVLTVLLLLGIQRPRTEIGLGLIPHVLTAFTNPFSFLVRSAHMSGAFSIPYLLIPFFMLGINAFFKPVMGVALKTKENFYAALVFFSFALSIFLLFYSIREFNSLEIISTIILFALLIVAFRLCNRDRLLSFRFKIILLACLIVVDGFSFSHYVGMVTRQMNIKPSGISGLDGMVLPDFINPKSVKTPLIQFRLPTGCLPSYIACDPINAQGYLLGFNDIQKYTVAGSEYKPRHESFVPLADKNSDASAFLRSSNDFMVCILKNADSIERPDCKVSGLSWSVLTLSNSFDLWRQEEAYDVFEVFIGDQKLLENRVTSSYFRNVPNVTLSLNNVPFDQVDGKIFDKFQFDLSNIKRGFLYVSLPKEALMSELKLSVANYKTFDPFWFSAGPNFLKFKIDSRFSQYSVLKIPFDRDMRVLVNGDSVKFDRVHGAFIGFHLNSGLSEIKLEYNSRSWVSFLYVFSVFSLILVSFILSFSGTLRGLKRKKLNLI